MIFGGALVKTLPGRLSGSCKILCVAEDVRAWAKHQVGQD